MARYKIPEVDVIRRWNARRQRADLRLGVRHADCCRIGMFVPILRQPIAQESEVMNVADHA